MKILFSKLLFPIKLGVGKFSASLCNILPILVAFMNKKYSLDSLFFSIVQPSVMHDQKSFSLKCDSALYWQNSKTSVVITQKRKGK